MAQGGVDARFFIFPAGPADAEALAQVHVTAWRETYAGLLPEAYLARMSEAMHAGRFARRLLRPGPDDVTLAAGGRGGLVGYAEGGPSRRRRPEEAEIATLYVLRSAQGLGLGAGLLTSVARSLASRGARTLMISVLQDNHRARAFYERMGGRPEPARSEAGPGGGRVSEVAYVWPDIRRITDPSYRM